MVSIKERDMKTEIRRQENSSKITMTKKSLIQHLIRFGASTLADIAKDLDLSIPNGPVEPRKNPSADYLHTFYKYVCL